MSRGELRIAEDNTNFISLSCDRQGKLIWPVNRVGQAERAGENPQSLSICNFTDPQAKGEVFAKSNEVLANNQPCMSHLVFIAAIQGYDRELVKEIMTKMMENIVRGKATENHDKDNHRIGLRHCTSKRSASISIAKLGRDNWISGYRNYAIDPRGLTRS